MSVGMSIANAAGKVVLNAEHKSLLLGPAQTMTQPVSAANYTNIYTWSGTGMDTTDPSAYRFKIPAMPTAAPSVYLYPISRCPITQYNVGYTGGALVGREIPVGNALDSSTLNLFFVPVGHWFGVMRLRNLRAYGNASTCHSTSSIATTWKNPQLRPVRTPGNLTSAYGMALYNAAGQLTYSTEEALGLFDTIRTFTPPIPGGGFSGNGASKDATYAFFCNTGWIAINVPLYTAPYPGGGYFCALSWLVYRNSAALYTLYVKGSDFELGSSFPIPQATLIAGNAA